MESISPLTNYVRLPTIPELLIVFTLALLVYLANVFLLKPFTSPLRCLPGPEGGYGLNGHALVIMDLYGRTIHEWISQYGKTFLVHGPFGVHHRIYTLDPRAISHVLNNTSIYFKSDVLRNMIRKYMKEGLVVAEGDRHKVQRKVAQRLFSRNGLRGMSEIVEEKAIQFRDIIHNLLNDPQSTTPYSPSPCSTTSPPGSREIDIYAAASRCTFDVIGQVSIDHTFNSIGNWDGEGGELFERYEKMQNPISGLGFFLGILFPWFAKVFPSENAKLVAEAMNPLEELSKNMMIERQKDIDEGRRELPSDNRDLLTLMLRSNMAKETTPDQKLRDDEITGQLATFMFAGSDTTAGTIAMALYQLAKHPEIQNTLRDELSNYGDNLSYEQMDELPYLDAVVKEVLRINPSLPGVVRQAQKDDIIPLLTPVQLTNGRVVNELRIRKGQIVHIPIEHLHTCKEIWGEDAKVFNPSRFLGVEMEHSKTPLTASFPIPALNSPWSMSSIPEFNDGDMKTRNMHQNHDTPSKDEREFNNLNNIPQKTTIPSNVPSGPGVWPNFMSFIDGPRRYIGYKLAIMEIKFFLFILLKDFEVLEKEDTRIWRWNLLSTRPYLDGTLYEKGSSLPLIFRHCKGESNVDDTEISESRE